MSHRKTVATLRSSPVYLASEGKEVIVNELGRQTVASVLLGCLDVAVHLMLRLEPLVTTETNQLKNGGHLKRQTSRMGRGMDARPCGPSRAASACLGGHKKIRSLDECRQSVVAQQNASMRHEP